MGLIQSIVHGNGLIPTDWNTLAKTCLSSSQCLQFKTWWIDGAESQERQNQAHNVVISADQLLGKRLWTQTRDQLDVEELAIGKLKQICLTAWEKIEVEGKTHSSFQKILQGPQKPYVDFLARLQEAINKHN